MMVFNGSTLVFQTNGSGSNPDHPSVPIVDPNRKTPMTLTPEQLQAAAMRGEQQRRQRQAQQAAQFETELSIFTSLLSVEYGRARNEQAKSKDKNPELKVDMLTPFRVARAATHRFMQMQFPPEQKQEAKDLLKDTEKKLAAESGAALPAEEKSPGGIIVSS
jgi:hypothetical protein